MMNQLRVPLRTGATLVCALLLTLVFVVGAGAGPAKAGISFQTYNRDQGWDTCAHPSAAAFSAWWSNSPNFVYGTYLGGDNGTYVGCTNIGTGLLDDAVNDDWGVIPAWYGPQMPESCGQGYFPDTIDVNPSLAYTQGEAQANEASAAAKADGYDTFDVIYYDLESWGDDSSTCLDSAEAYINGWDHQMDANTPYIGGMYGSTCGSFLDDFSGIANAPFDVWAADPDTSNPWIFNLVCLSNSDWTSNQRIHQFSEPVNLSYGGYPITVDEDCADAEVDTNYVAVDANNCAYAS